MISVARKLLVHPLIWQRVNPLPRRVVRSARVAHLGQNKHVIEVLCADFLPFWCFSVST